MGEFDDLIVDFMQEADEALETLHSDLDGLESDPSDKEILDSVYRAIHTIKGGCGMFGFEDCQEACHKLEDFLSELKARDEGITSDELVSVRSELEAIERLLAKYKNPEANAGETQTLQSAETPRQENVSSTEASKENRPQASKSPAAKVSKKAENDAYVRVPLNKMEDALTSVWEIFLIRNQMSYLFEKNFEALRELPEFLRSWEVLDSSLRRSIAELEQKAMGMRLVSVSGLFGRMKRVVNQYLTESDKKIHFQTLGEDIELDKKVLDSLAEPMIHLVRNALDHGVESPGLREKNGKAPEGRVTMAARTHGNEVVISIADDGKGLDAKKLIESAQSKGLDVSDVTSDTEAYQLIFRPGFSTAQEVSEISGRGVGMDAVKTAVERLRGDIEIETELGSGTTFNIRLPLSMSLVSTTICDIGGVQYAVNNSDIIEARTIQHDEIKLNGEEQFLQFRGDLVPCYDAREYFMCRDDSPEFFRRNLAVFFLKYKSGYCAILADRLERSQELVIKPMPDVAPKVPYYSAVSILSTGTPVFVLALGKLCEEMERERRLKEKAHGIDMAG